MKALFIILSIALSGTAYSQCMDSLWRQAPGTAGGDWASSIVRSADGSGIIAGYQQYSTAPWYAVGTLKKVHYTGQEIWSHDYVNLGSMDVFLDVERFPTGGYICAGWSRTPVTLVQNYWLLRTNEDGDSLWSRTYSNGFSLQGRCVTVASNGGFAIAGRAHSLPGGFGGQDWLLIKTDSDGDSLWSVIIGDSLEDTCNDIIRTGEGYHLLVGNSLTDTSRAGRMALVNQSGDILWNRLYTFDVSVDIQSVTQLPDSSFLACGTSTPRDGDNQVFLMEVGPDGQYRWHRTYDVLPDANDVAFALEWDGFEGGYVFGMGYRNSNQEADGFVLHITPCYDLVATTWVGNGYNENIRDGARVGNASLIMVGAVTLENNQQDMLYYGIKQDTCNIPPCSFTRVAPEDSTMPDLQIEYPIMLTWTPSYDQEGAPVSYIFELETNLPEIFITSPLSQVSPDTFYALELQLPLSPLDQIFDFRWRVWATDGRDTVEASNGEGFFQLDIILDADDNRLTPSDFTLSVFPNPFNPTTTLSFTLTQSTRVQLNLFDIQGRLVQTPASKMMSAGAHTVTVDGSALSSGIYFAKLQAGAQSRVAKLVLMK